MMNVGIVGATGFAGAELIRILLNHKNVKISAISSHSFEGEKFSSVYPMYANLFDDVLVSQNEVIEKSDVVFAALPHGLSEDLAIDTDKWGRLFIDLGADFRLEDESEYEEWYKGEYKEKYLHKKSVYSIPELHRQKIQNHKIIANPGCYPTATSLALAPALKAGIIETTGIVVDAKSGITGAGRNPSQSTHFATFNESFTAYKIGSHRHTPEIEQVLSEEAGEKLKLIFTPHLIPINRGILASCYGRISDKVQKTGIIDIIRDIYKKSYENEHFIRVLDGDKVPDVKNVRYTNMCEINVFCDERTRTFVAVSAIDNMVKGAAGQAIQNMNIACGFDEKEGLENLIPSAF